MTKPTEQQIAAESDALMKLMVDPRFSGPIWQAIITRVLNELAWINDGVPPPVSKILVDEITGLGHVRELGGQ